MQVQHCEKCGGEYVAAAKACAECGGALSPGPPPSTHGASSHVDGADESEEELEIRLDTLLVTLPGQQAHALCKTLTLDGIFAAQRCGADVQYSGPEVPERPVLAQTMPVEIYVAHADIETARAVLQELQSELGIRDPSEHSISEDDLEREALAASAVEAAPVETSDVAATDESGGGSTTWLIVGLVVAVVVVMMLLGR